MTRRYEGKIVKEAESHALTEEFLIRPPRQERSRRAWARVLEAGASLFEEGGMRRSPLRLSVSALRLPSGYLRPHSQQGCASLLSTSTG